MKRILFIIGFMSINCSNAFSQALDQQISKMAQEICEQMKNRGIKTIAISIPKYKNQETEFGQMFANKLSGKLTLICSSLTVTNQSKLAVLLAQNKLTAEGIIVSESEASKLGKVTGIEAMGYGIINVIGESIDVTFNIIELSTTNLIGNTNGSITLTNSYLFILNTPINTKLIQTTSTKQNNLPNPKSDCKYKPSCVVCITNKASIAIQTQAQLSNDLYGYSGSTIYIHPNSTKCWEEIIFNSNPDHDEIRVTYTISNTTQNKIDRKIIEPCGVYEILFKD